MPWPDIFFKARKPAEKSSVPGLVQPKSTESPTVDKTGAETPAASTTVPATAPAPEPKPARIEPMETATRTLPAMHGVILRAPTSTEKAPAVVRTVDQLMAEADPVRTLTQSGGVHMLKRSAPEAAQQPNPVGPVLPDKPSAPAATESASSTPDFSAPPSTPEAAAKETAAKEISLPTEPVPAPSAAPVSTFGSIFRRKAKLTEVARIVLPPKREESEPAPVPAGPSSTVVPPAFPVVAMTARANSPSAQKTDTARELPEKKSVDAAQGVTAGSAPTTLSSGETPVEPKVDLNAHKPGSASVTVPHVDPNAHKPGSDAEEKKGGSPEQAAASTAAMAIPEKAASATPEKREFHLANGERVAGTVLSETPEAVYVEHGTLGVVTIPRTQIAKRLVEIILINGDRIVGDIMAETADTLYVRHASLGMLTVPRAHRSTRVVEAILKDGDRILGEVLTETDTFTVIRSATLGTVTVPHAKVAMLNRKVEQVELKALAAPGPELKDKAEK